MKIIVLLLLAAWTFDLCASEYPRYKIRGPPPPPRPPQVPQYVKKWQHGPPRPPVRGGRPPIPVHMPPGHKIPMGIPPLGNRPIASIPVRNFWKNTQASFNLQPENLYIPKQEKPIVFSKPDTQFVQQLQQQQLQQQQQQLQQKPIEKPYIPKEKPFYGSPTIKNHDLDYHIQTNNIPTHAHPIKQVGEKGPIHTIPAPKLGPQDKPSSIVDVQNSHNTHHNYADTFVSIQKSHSYQVTEAPEPTKYYQQQQQQQQAEPSIDTLKLYQQQNQQVQVQELQQPSIYFSIDPTSPPQNLGLQSQGLQSQGLSTYTNPKVTQVEQAAQLTQKELQQLLNQQYPQDNFESYKLPQTSDSLSQTQQLYQQHMNHENYQALLTQLPQVFQQEPYRNLEADDKTVKVGAEEKLSIQPEFHSFNYNEQEHNKRRSDSQDQISSSLVNDGYVIDSEGAANEEDPITIGRNPQESMAQAQYIQSYFQTRDDGEGENHIEPDAKPSAEGDKEEELTSFYSTLPNKEAADSLTQLQSAGKVNSNLMKLSTTDIIKGKTPLTIFVPDDSHGKIENPEDVQLKDYDLEEFDDEAEEEKQIPTSFGHRIKPKIRRR